MAGEEVAQLYLSTGKISPDIEMPVKQLRAFEKVMLQPNQSTQITFKLTPEELYIYNQETKSYQVPSGEFILHVGGASNKLKLNTTFTLHQAEAKPDLSVVNIRTMPVYPKEGDEVIFLASIINNGTGATHVGDAHIIRFYVDGKEVAYFNSTSISIPVGGMELACAEALKDGNWKAPKGTFRITAKIEAADKYDLNPENNSCEAQISIPNGKVIPLEMLRILEASTFKQN